MMSDTQPGKTPKITTAQTDTLFAMGIVGSSSKLVIRVTADGNVLAKLKSAA